MITVKIDSPNARVVRYESGLEMEEAQSIAQKDMPEGSRKILLPMLSAGCSLGRSMEYCPTCDNAGYVGWAKN